jgi:hypothetical protein
MKIGKLLFIVIGVVLFLVYAVAIFWPSETPVGFFIKLFS